MAITITVPRLGWTMEEGIFVGWLKRDGDEVRPGEMLFELEGEKASQEIESLDGGILRIPPDAPKPGNVVKVGAVLGYLCKPDESLENRIRNERLVEPTANNPKTESSPTSFQSTNRNLQSEGPIPISPRARHVARELGVEWTSLRGSGRSGRIRERDVRAAAQSQRVNLRFDNRNLQSAIPGRLLPLSPTRRAIARRMAAGVHEAAPVTMVTKAAAANLISLREQFRSAAERARDTATPVEPVPSFTDIIVKLAAVVLREHRMLSAQWRDEGILVPDEIHVSVAVDTDSGLVAPVICNADKLSLRQIAVASAALVERARSHTLHVSELEGGTFTVSNLGMFGIDAFTPIINLPQCSILGIGRIVREPAVIGDQIVPCEMLTLSLTFDHRVVDGAPAARFLNAIRTAVENPAALLVS